MKTKKWQLLSPDSSKDIVKALLKNRGITTKIDIKEFLNPLDPSKISLKELGISKKEINLGIKRIQKAISKGESIVVYGDYDADGICSTAILWETLFSKTKKITPYIPDRFVDGYGINPKTIERIKADNPDVKLIITVDNGIVAFEAVTRARELGIDVIITDHHQKDSKIPKALAVIHSDKIAGSGVAWIFSYEIIKNQKLKANSKDKLELAAIGTIADQFPLIGFNRSIVKFGLNELKRTVRPGLIALYTESGIKPDSLGTYEVNFLIAPRLNAMGRLKHAIDSLRLICTKDERRATALAVEIGDTNKERQNMVEEVLKKARSEVNIVKEKSSILVSGDYHEGVIGLAAGKLVEDFGRPAIVFSVGSEISKASARSIPDFNIIKEIKKLDNLLLGAGGHPMAAGFSLKTANISDFIKKFQKSSSKILNSKVLKVSLRIDMKLEFGQIDYDLLNSFEDLKPFGNGNPTPVFLTEGVVVTNIKVIGQSLKHLKLKLEKDGHLFDAIGFNLSDFAQIVSERSKVDIVYNIQENIWNGNRSLQLMIKDIKLNNV